MVISLMKMVIEYDWTTKVGDFAINCDLNQHTMVILMQERWV